MPLRNGEAGTVLALLAQFTVGYLLSSSDSSGRLAPAHTHAPGTSLEPSRSPLAQTCAKPAGSSRLRAAVRASSVPGICQPRPTREYCRCADA